jgi:hypothetical protein
MEKIKLTDLVDGWKEAYEIWNSSNPYRSPSIDTAEKNAFECGFKMAILRVWWNEVGMPPPIFSHRIEDIKDVTQVI